MNADTMIPVIAGRDAGVNTISAEATAIRAGGHTGVHLRPLGRGERPAVVEVFAGLSARSRALRFLAAVPKLDERMLAWMTDVDQDEHVAWVAHVGQRAVGLASYVRPADEPTAEVALAVADDHQRLGIGRLLLETMMVVAASAGIMTLVFHTHYTNSAMRGLLSTLGATGSYSGAVLELRTPVTAPPCPRFDPVAIQTLAAEARGATAAA